MKMTMISWIIEVEGGEDGEEILRSREKTTSL